MQMIVQNMKNTRKVIIPCYGMFYIPTNTVNLVLPIFLSDSLKHDEKNVCAFDFIRSHCQCCFCSPPPTILNECIEQSKWSIDDKHQQYNQMPNESSQTQIPIHTVREYTDTEIEKKRDSRSTENQFEIISSLNFSLRQLQCCVCAWEVARSFDYGCRVCSW